MQRKLLFIVSSIFVLYCLYVGDSDAITNFQTTNELDCGFSQDFTTFLKDNGYDEYKFDRPDLICAAYGGKSEKSEKLNHYPVIFIHGNSDIGFGRGKADGNKDWQTGFRSLATYLTE